MTEAEVMQRTYAVFAVAVRFAASAMHRQTEATRRLCEALRSRARTP